MGVKMGNFLDWQDNQASLKRTRIDEKGSNGDPSTGSGFEQGNGGSGTATVVPSGKQSVKDDILFLLDLFDGSLRYGDYPLTERQEKLMRGSEWELRSYLKNGSWPNEEDKEGALTAIARGGTPLGDLLCS